MYKPVKNLITTSLIAIFLAGNVLVSYAADDDSRYPRMMQGRWNNDQGYGPGMMGGGYGPGMMGGGYGQGMMGGGFGPGMMGGYGPGMMGGGMGPQHMLDLTDAQNAQIDKIQADVMKKQRTLMRQMWDEQDKLNDLYDKDKPDPAAIGKVYSKLSDLQRQAVENRIEAQNQMNALLTKEQKEQLHRFYRGSGRGMMGW